jgi:hypothetical protein
MSYQVTVQYGTVYGTSGVAQPAFFDESNFDNANFDVITVLSAAGVTERIPARFSVSVTQYSTTQLSTGLVMPLQTSAYVVTSG